MRRRRGRAEALHRRRTQRGAGCRRGAGPQGHNRAPHRSRGCHQGHRPRVESANNAARTLQLRTFVDPSRSGLIRIAKKGPPFEERPLFAMKRHGSRSGRTRLVSRFERKADSSSVVHHLACMTGAARDAVDIPGCRRPKKRIGKAKLGRRYNATAVSITRKSMKTVAAASSRGTLTVRQPERPAGRTASIRHSIRSFCCYAGLPSAASRLLG